MSQVTENILEKFVVEYNRCWLEGFGYEEVARRLEIERREAIQLAYQIRRAEKLGKVKESCLKGKLSRRARIAEFVIISKGS